MECPNCGNTLSRSAKFCHKCGYRLPEKEKKTESHHTTSQNSTFLYVSIALGVLFAIALIAAISINSTNGQLNNTNLNLNAQVQTLSNQRTALQANLTSANGTIANLKLEVSNNNSTIQNQASSITHLNSQIQSLDQQIQNLQSSSSSSVSSLQNQVSSLQSQNNNLTSNIDFQNQQVIIQQTSGNLQLQPSGQAGDSYSVQVTPNYSGELYVVVTTPSNFKITLSGAGLSSPIFTGSYNGGTNIAIALPVIGNPAHQYTYTLTITNTNPYGSSSGQWGVAIYN